MCSENVFLSPLQTCKKEGRFCDIFEFFLLKNVVTDSSQLFGGKFVIKKSLNSSVKTIQKN